MVDQVERARAAVERWHLGQTSERFESSFRGAGTISSGVDDHGGKSYGSYQLSSNSGTLREYLRWSRFRPEFDGLQPTTAAFDARWREIAGREPGFKADQHEFIGRSHYNRECERLRDAGIDLSGRGRAVQDMLWRTAVQMRGLTPGIIANALRRDFGTDYDLAAISDRQLIESVQDYKLDHTQSIFRSSPNLWPGLENRARNEKADLLRLEESERILQDLQRAPCVRPLDGAGCVPGLLNRLGEAAQPDSQWSPRTRAVQTDIERRVAEIDRELGRRPDQASRRLTDSLTRLALEHGFDRVDHVKLNVRTDTAAAGERVFIVQGGLDDAARRLAHMSTADALAAPSTTTREQIAALDRQSQTQAESTAASLVPQRSESSPALRMG